MIKLLIVTFLCFLLLGPVKAVVVDINKEWVNNFGWQVTCQWHLDMDDSLQSVTLSRNRQQFFIFRPETKNGEKSKSDVFHLSEVTMTVDCMLTVDNGVIGQCRLSVEPHLAPEKDFSFGCAVSGERPYFKFAEKEVNVEALVPPTDAVMVVTRAESGPATINCTSKGIPAPKILWTVNNQTVPHIFHNSEWNSTSKLWDVWSSFTPQSDATKVLCTPEVTKENRLIRGQPVQYNYAYRIFLDGALLTLAALSTLILI